ncbi:hypothetical protein OIDMADRAFT_200431 [Oidiodendron maius Zn]|uniref:Amino acid permease/ SLC12A domain-containing protein n=1 Tax=Oidiodendron maius (strain Zn) TaxID=913774 RepID=A0A0C3H853_OIDMZ|nr:hypothetical protein OIDMADRAFT_200431 [Oidiodendron maius Zn]
MGTVMGAVISCLIEMTALMPVNAPVMEFPRRFLDRGVGFSIGWMYWFAYAVLASDELVAVADAINFTYEDGTTSLRWTAGNNVNPLVWIALFLVLATIINMAPVKWFGEIEYVLGSLKLIFITMLIVMMIILATMTHWSNPFGFFNDYYNVRDEGQHLQRTIRGSVGTFIGMWTTTIHVIFSYVGMDIVAATAAESKALPDAESMKMASRKISIRIVTLYAFAMLAGSFVVPTNHPFINGKGTSLSASSIYIIAVVEAGIPAAAHFFNAIFVLASFTCAVNSMYVASRVLYTLALQGQTGPEFITRRLCQCKWGVPSRSVLVTGCLMMLAFMGSTGTPGMRLSELESNCTVSYLLIYIAICATYLCFFRTLDRVKRYGNISESQAASYDRNHPRYPYKSHGQWLKAAYGLVACIILITFNGVNSFLEHPFGRRQFIASYISIPVFILLILGYKIRKHGFNLMNWGPERSNDLRNTVQVSSETRKGRLRFPDNGSMRENFVVFLHWVWVWMK